MAPPPLSVQSAERMKRVVDQADSLVDDGMDPHAAIAKAAQAHALPVGHVPIVVRAFNTGRAVRQYGAEDPWEKAAEHPVATIDGVVARLEGGTPAPAKRASDLSHYARPPVVAKPDFPRLVRLEDRPQPPPVVEKQASVPKPVDNRRNLEFAAAAAFDLAAEIAEGLTPAGYHGAKQAALRISPDAAECFFGMIEGEREIGGEPVPVNPRISKLASVGAVPDPTIPNDHPLVRAIQALAAAKEAYVVPESEPVPEGYELATAPGGIRFHRKLAVCPVFGTVLQPKAAAASPEPASTGFDLLAPSTEKLAKVGEGLNSVSQGIKDFASGTGGPAFWRGFRGTLGTPLAATLSNPLIGRAVDLAPESDDRARSRAVGGLEGDLQRINFQSAAQSMLADPRFANADPKIVIDTYRDLTNLAPMAMANRSIASDFIQRRLQTGPLSYWDLEKLTGIEKNLATARRDSSQPEGE